jgi:hypothetical protein
MFLIIGNQVDTFLPDHSITFHYKFLLGLIGVGLVMKVAQGLKSVVLRQPIKGDNYL